MSAGIPRTTRRIGYARVSTESQTTFQYADLLEAAKCDRIYMDEGVSALAKCRPGLERARKALRPGDTLVVPAIDRAFRSTIEGITFLDGLHAEGITFESIYQRIDTRTPEGRKWFIDMVNNAEYERAIISRRTKEKMAAARRKGIHLGRPRKLTAEATRRAYDRLIASGQSVHVIARSLSICDATLRRSLKREGLMQ